MEILYVAITLSLLIGVVVFAILYAKQRQQMVVTQERLAVAEDALASASVANSEAQKSQERCARSANGSVWLV